MFRYIYRYRNKLNGKVYIGQTIDIERRKSEHPSELISTLSLKERVDFAVGDALEYLEDRILVFDTKIIFTNLLKYYIIIISTHVEVYYG